MVPNIFVSTKVTDFQLNYQWDSTARWIIESILKSVKILLIISLFLISPLINL